MKAYLHSLLITAISCSTTFLAAQVQVPVIPEMALLQDIQNRKTIVHDDGQREVFTVTEVNTKVRPQRLYHWYHAQQVHSTQGGYDGKLLHGSYTAYYPNKQLYKQGRYKKGLADGSWKEWRTNERLAKEENWKKGKRSGAASHYDESGQLLLQGQMKNGQWQGKVWTYSAADSSYSWNYYAAGKSISREAYIDSNLFRRSGRFFGELWNRLFHSPKETDVPTP